MLDGPDGPAPRAPRRVLALALLAPTLFLAGALLPGARFLPHLPVILEPLASEHPEEAARARAEVSYGPADRIFPTLSDQLAARAELAHGDLPTWEPALGLGAPLFANSIAGLGYPPNWLGLLAPPERAAGPLAWLTLALAGLGMGLFLRRVGLSAGAVALGVIGLQAGGFGLVNLHYSMKVDAALWLPFSLWAVEGVARGVRRSALWLTAFTALSLLAGFPPIALFSLGAAGVYAVVRLAGGARLLGAEPLDPGSVAGPRLIARALVALALGVGAGAWQLLPMFEASGQSMRAADASDELTEQALPLATLLGVVVPDVAGAPSALQPAGGLPLAWWLTPAAGWQKAVDANAVEWHLYAGLALVLLALAAVAAEPKRALVPALALLFCYAFAQGWPGARLFYRLPGLGAGAPNRVLAVAWVLWPWLAALGAEAVLAARPRARAALALGAAVAALLAGAGVLWLEPERFAPWLQGALLERYAGLPDPPTAAVIAEQVPLEAAVAAGAHLERALERSALIALATAAAGALFLVRRAPRGLAAALLLATALADGLWTARHELRSQHPRDLSLFPPSEAIEAVSAAAGDGRVVRLDPSASHVEDVERLARPNMLEVYGISDLTPWTVFTPRGLVELVGESDRGARDGLDPAAHFRSGIAGITRPELLGAPLLDLLRVTCVLAREPVEHASLELAFERPGFHVYRRRGALPPARIVPEGVAVASDEIARRLLVTGAVDPARQALLAPGVAARAPAPGAGEAVIEGPFRPAKNRLDLRVRGSRGGLLVMHEQWFPGWKATINGADAEVLRVDHVYRGLWLPAGELDIRTRYAPASLRTGFVLLLLCLGTAAWLGLRRGW